MLNRSTIISSLFTNPFIIIPIAVYFLQAMLFHNSLTYVCLYSIYRFLGVNYQPDRFYPKFHLIDLGLINLFFGLFVINPRAGTALYPTNFLWTPVFIILIIHFHTSFTGSLIKDQHLIIVIFYFLHKSSVTVKEIFRFFMLILLNFQ